MKNKQKVTIWAGSHGSNSVSIDGIADRFCVKQTRYGTQFFRIQDGKTIPIKLPKPVYALSHPADQQTFCQDVLACVSVNPGTAVSREI